MDRSLSRREPWRQRFSLWSLLLIDLAASGINGRMCASVSSLGKILKRASSASRSFGWIVPVGIGPTVFRIEPCAPKSIGNYGAIDRLRRMTRPPADDITSQPTLTENIPERLTLSRRAGIRARSAILIGSGSINPWMPCLSASLPVATEFQSIGDRIGCRVARLPITPRSMRAFERGHEAFLE